MQKVYKVAVIGGGSAGLVCAVELFKGENPLKKGEVIILEKNDRVGKKLITTGNGQGNLTNACISSSNFYGEKAFISAFIEDVKAIDTEEYLYSLGIPLVEGDDGKKYPVSRQASAVLDVLRAYLDNVGAETVTEFFVDRIVNTGNVYKIVSGDKSVFAEKVVIAVGGSAAPHLGTDGSSYVLAEKLGHKKTPLYPSLVQLKTDLTAIKGLKGLKEQATVTAFDGDIPLKSNTGEILFTEYGVSGSAIFQISGHLAKAKNPYIIVEFLPEYGVKQTEKLLSDKRKNTPFMNSEDILCGILNKRIGQAVLKTALSERVRDVTYALKNFKLKVTGTLGFKYAQVTKGGIQTDKIIPHTYQSKLSKGAYLIGEMLDVDGDCGGYNLTFAFVSAICAARDIKKHFISKK